MKTLEAANHTAAEESERMRCPRYVYQFGQDFTVLDTTTNADGYKLVMEFQNGLAVKQHPECGHCVIAVSPNAWGRGETVADALKQLVRAGGKRSRAQLRFIVGDTKAYVNEMGDLTIHNGAISYKI